MANDTTPYLMVLLLNNDVWCKSREVVVLRNLIEQAWGNVLAPLFPDRGCILS